MRLRRAKEVEIDDLDKLPSLCVGATPRRSTIVRLMKKITVIFLLLPALSGYAQDQTYENPVDKKAYTAPGGWQTYSPEGGVHSSADKVALDSVRLLQAQQEIQSRTTIEEELGSFIKLAEFSASEVFSHYEKPATLLVQFTCTPGRHVVEIASQGEPPQDLLQAYYDKLKNLKPLRVSDEVKFQLTIKVKP